MSEYLCPGCTLETSQPSWSDASTARFDFSSGCVVVDRLHIPICPNCFEPLKVLATNKPWRNFDVNA